MNNFLEGLKTLLKAAPASTSRFHESAQTMLHGMEEARVEFEKKKSEIQDDIRRGAKRTDHKLPF
jgi:secreted Zn-dependent insulinase-like peptidase